MEAAAEAVAAEAEAVAAEAEAAEAVAAEAEAAEAEAVAGSHLPLKFHWNFKEVNPARAKNGYWKTNFYEGIYWRMCAGLHEAGHRSHIFAHFHPWGDRSKAQLWNANLRIDCRLYDLEGHLIMRRKRSWEANQRHFARSSWKMSIGAKRKVAFVEFQLIFKSLEVKDLQENPSEESVGDFTRVLVNNRTLWVPKKLVTDLSPVLQISISNPGYRECQDNRIDLSHCEFEHVMALLNVAMYRRGVNAQTYRTLTDMGRMYQCDRVLYGCSRWLGRNNPRIPAFDKLYIEDSQDNEDELKKLAKNLRAKQLKQCQDHPGFSIMSNVCQETINGAIKYKYRKSRKIVFTDDDEPVAKKSKDEAGAEDGEASVKEDSSTRRRKSRH